MVVDLSWESDTFIVTVLSDLVVRPCPVLANLPCPVLVVFSLPVLAASLPLAFYASL